LDPADRMELDDAAAEPDGGALPDAGSPQGLFRHAPPAAAADYHRVAVGKALLADPAVADVHDAVGDRRGRGVVAHDERRGGLVTGQVGKQSEDAPRVPLR